MNEVRELIEQNARLKAAFDLMKRKHTRDIEAGYSGSLHKDDIDEIFAVAGLEDKEVDLISFQNTDSPEPEEEINEGLDKR